MPICTSPLLTWLVQVLQPVLFLVVAAPGVFPGGQVVLAGQVWVRVVVVAAVVALPLVCRVVRELPVSFQGSYLSSRSYVSLSLVFGN